MRNICFSPQAWEDFEHWHGQDKKTLSKILALIDECARSPFSGTGKPEPLRHEYQGYWSRRIDHANRMVYKADADNLHILILRYHYD